MDDNTLKAVEAEREERRLDMMIRDFSKRYEPEERRYRLDFEMELHRIVREIYREAVKPYENALVDAAMRTPPHPIFVPDPNKKPDDVSATGQVETGRNAKPQ